MKQIKIMQHTNLVEKMYRFIKHIQNKTWYLSLTFENVREVHNYIFKSCSIQNFSRCLYCDKLDTCAEIHDRYILSVKWLSIAIQFLCDCKDDEYVCVNSNGGLNILKCDNFNIQIESKGIIYLSD